MTHHTLRDYKLKLSSKRLKSGKYQVKFYLTKPEHEGLYGYLLTPGGTSVKEVVTRIYDRLGIGEYRTGSLGLTRSDDNEIVIFEPHKHNNYGNPGSDKY